MRKSICLLVTILIVMTTMCVYTSASNGGNEYTCEVNGTEYTVEFENNVPANKYETIAQALIGINDSSIEPYGLGCTLFGHDYAYTTVSVIQHKVAKYVPRCRKETYDVTYCEDCDYTEETLVAVNYIDCCPED